MSPLVVTESARILSGLRAKKAFLGARFSSPPNFGEKRSLYIKSLAQIHSTVNVQGRSGDISGIW